MSARVLPVADGTEVRRFISVVARHHRRELAGVLLLYGMAAVSGLVGPKLLGNIVQDVQDGTTAAHVTVIAGVLTGFMLLQAVLIRYAFRAAGRLAAVVLAEIREKFVDDALALPLNVVERSDDGDLVTRASGDVAAIFPPAIDSKTNASVHRRRVCRAYQIHRPPPPSE